MDLQFSFTKKLLELLIQPTHALAIYLFNRLGYGDLPRDTAIKLIKYVSLVRTQVLFYYDPAILTHGSAALLEILDELDVS